MAIPVHTRLLTAEEFERTPMPRDGHKTELFRGKVVRHMVDNDSHGIISSLLNAALVNFVMEHQLGVVNFNVGHTIERDPDTVLGPDVTWRALPPGTGPARVFVEHAPDLAIEVKSPGNTEHWPATKTERYLAAGSQRVWIGRPATPTVTVHLPEGPPRDYRSGHTLTSDDAGFPIEGFALPIDDLFVFES